jgi:centromere protein I
MFVEKLEKIDPPSQVIAGLRDPLLQKYLILNPSEEAIRRLEFWLQRYFEDEIELIDEGFGTSPTLADMFTALVSVAEASKV